jgi:periplasmic copper chaperone A
LKRIFISILAGVLLLTACGTEKGIEIHSAWMRPAAQGENGAVYFVIHNHSSTADELVGASSNIAEAVEMHESVLTDGDVMQMHEVTSVPLDAFAEIEFTPGGLHMMLVGLKLGITVGDEIEVILHFRNFEDIRIMVPVRETAAPDQDH